MNNHQTLFTRKDFAKNTRADEILGDLNILSSLYALELRKTKPKIKFYFIQVRGLGVKSTFCKILRLWGSLGIYMTDITDEAKYKS